MILPSLLAAPIGCTALIVGVAAASDPRLRNRATSPLLSPVLVAFGAALALGPVIDSWSAGLSGIWLGVQVVLLVAMVLVLVQDGRRAGYGAAAPRARQGPPPRPRPYPRPEPPEVGEP